ncbi:hypothetical protein GLOIN_2v1780813 [Rhizophagus clarus]|uniref:Uncharacterized protein n=1 Tax=Rhizophagus clarus TaxID=94130 RepID=A0A8H3LZ22_9GLOM|nr:hypothetical protein GLOIN_2v1780813 [Rhizophagus clarus]
MTYKRLIMKAQHSDEPRQKYRKSYFEEYSDTEIASSSKNTEVTTDTTITLIHVKYLLKSFILGVRGTKGAKRAKGAGGAGSTGSARGLRKSKRVLNHSATYHTEEEEEEKEKDEEEDEEESQQSTQQSTISTKPPVERSIIRRSITPIVKTSIISPTSTQSTRSHHSTPVIETDIIPLVSTNRSQQQMSGTDDHHALTPCSNTSNVKTDMIAKHSRQIQAIYELQKATFEKISIIQNQVKKLTSSKNTDLSPKVFSDAYAAVCSKFSPSKMWPSFEEYKASMEKWLNSNHANYLKEIGDWEWVNAFARKYHSALLCKMKDIRGSHASVIRTAIFRNFGLQLTSRQRKNSQEVLEWKNSKEVADSYKKLYANDATIENIAAITFPSSITMANEEE